MGVASGRNESEPNDANRELCYMAGFGEFCHRHFTHTKCTKHLSSSGVCCAGNEFQSEALQGALPVGQNNPQVLPKPILFLTKSHAENCSFGGCP